MDIKKLREKFPAGTKVKLHHMDDIQAPPPGTIGTVKSVDDDGQIHVAWETGSSLALALGEDSFEVLKQPEFKK